MDADQHRRKVAAFLHETDVMFASRRRSKYVHRYVAARLMACDGADVATLCEVFSVSRFTVRRMLEGTAGNPCLWGEQGRECVSAYTSGDEMPCDMPVEEILGELGGVKVEHLLGRLSTDPSPEEIAAECLRIQDGWPPGEHSKRARDRGIKAKQLSSELRGAHGLDA